MSADASLSRKTGSTAEPLRIYLVSYPKAVFLYPTFLAALLAGFVLLFYPLQKPGEAPAAAKTASPAATAETTAETGKAAAEPGDNQPAVKPSSVPYTITTFVLIVFALNLLVFAFDFPRGTSLSLLFFVLTVIFALLLLFRYTDQLVPFLHEVLSSYQPRTNATFMFSLAAILGLIFVGVLINIRFDYWEVTPNELLHHHGMLSDLERFASPQLKIDKEINDVFEYLLLRSGRLILHPSSERRAIVLENVLNIGKKEAQLTRMLGALQVEVRAAPPLPDDQKQI